MLWGCRGLQILSGGGLGLPSWLSPLALSLNYDSAGESSAEWLSREPRPLGFSTSPPLALTLWAGGGTARPAHSLGSRAPWGFAEFGRRAALCGAAALCQGQLLVEAARGPASLLDCRGAGTERALCEGTPGKAGGCEL